jgi:signal transduction histidine kinase
MRDALRAIPLLAELPDQDLDLLAAGAYEEEAAAGSIIFRQGEDGDRACVLTAGEVEVVKAFGPREVLLAVRTQGEIIGEMALLDAAPRMATVRARVDSRFVSIPKQQMDELLKTSATAARSLFGVLLSRWRETESSLRQSERMAQIGTLTAGLAHEMNNPAAAVRRGSAQLARTMETFAATFGELQHTALAPETRSRIDTLLETARQRPEPLGALERADREAELESLVGQLGISEPWSHAARLVDAGVVAPKLELALAGLGAEHARLVVQAFCATAETSSLVQEIEEGAERLSAIVGALKSYSYLDQAEVQEVDVREGIEDTLLILKHKLGSIEVRRDYQGERQPIEAYGAELNQVWTNLIDNAADALLDAGVAEPLIALRVIPSAEAVTVEVEDNGPGIPQDVVGRVFDAFFTTKPPGSGTGLGLDITYAIVVHRHGGDISVESAPGRTVFKVTLPCRPSHPGSTGPGG